MTTERKISLLTVQRNILARVAAENITSCNVCPARYMCPAHNLCSEEQCSKALIEWVRKMTAKEIYYVEGI